MHAEFQALSPLVPVRLIKFLRLCKHIADGVWAVVDVSVDGSRQFSDTHSFANCRRLPSGCIVQDMPNGYSKVKKCSVLLVLSLHEHLLGSICLTKCEHRIELHIQGCLVKEFRLIRTQN